MAEEPGTFRGGFRARARRLLGSVIQKTWSAGDPLLADQLNLHVRDWNNASALGVSTERGQLFFATDLRELQALARPTGLAVLTMGANNTPTWIPFITDAQIADATIAAGKLVAKSVVAAQLADDLLLARHFPTGVVVAAAMGPNAIVSAAIANDQIIRRHIADRQITEAQLQHPYVSDVGEERITLNGAAAVDTGIARPTLAGTADEWGMVNFGDADALIGPIDGWVLNGPSTYTSIPSSGAIDVSALIGNWDGGVGASIDYLMVAGANPFSSCVMDLTGSYGNDRSLIVEYWDGNSWEDVADLVDGTDNGGAWKQSGTVAWTTPNDWATNAVNGSDSLYWVRMTFNDDSGGGFNLIVQSMVINAAGTAAGASRDAEWPIIRLNDLHDTDICPLVSVGTVLNGSNSLVFADAIGEGDDLFLGVLTGGNLALGVSMAGTNALPFSIKGLWR